MDNIYEERARIFKAFCDEKRQRILELLQNGEQCACVLLEQLDMPQSTLSYHMKILCESGVVEGREEGKWTHYRISESGSLKAIKILRDITKQSDEHTGCCSCGSK